MYTLIKFLFGLVGLSSALCNTLFYRPFHEKLQKPYTKQIEQTNFLQNKTDSYKIDPDVWLFAVDGLKRPYSFVDEQGNLVGFDIQLIEQVCIVAGKKCKVVLSDFTQCVYTYRDMDYPGNGLMAGWFDACPGYAVTLDRTASFDFTDPYLVTEASFTVAPKNPNKFNPSSSDFSNFTLVHLTGAYTNTRCLNRLHKTFGKVIIARDLPEAKEILLNNTAQALFSPRAIIDGLDVLPNRFHCDDGGAGIMVRKGSTLPSWWNKAFNTLYTSGEYEQLCQAASQKFIYKIKCLPPPVKETV